jgi:hypothetical protein
MQTSSLGPQNTHPPAVVLVQAVLLGAPAVVQPYIIEAQVGAAHVHVRSRQAVQNALPDLAAGLGPEYMYHEGAAVGARRIETVALSLGLSGEPGPA